MDKFEYKHLVEQIQGLIDEGNYAEAVAIADKIDWRRVRSVMMLGTISDLYKINCRYEDARDIMLLAYDRNPENRQICYSLCELYIKTGDPVMASEFYKEFEKLAPKNPGRYVLKYKLYEAFDTSLEERIEVLEELKKQEYQEKWMYELAYLYHRLGLATKCVETCDELILWFGTGKYVIKAMELKMLHEPLTASQQKKYDHRFDPENAEDSAEEEPEAETPAEPSRTEKPAAEDLPDDLPTRAMTDTQIIKIRDAQDNSASKNAADQLGATRIFDVDEIRSQLKEKTPQTEELDIQVKTVDVGQYNTMNLQAEIAAGLKEVLDKEKEAGAQEAEPDEGPVKKTTRPIGGPVKEREPEKTKVSHREAKTGPLRYHADDFEKESEESDFTMEKLDAKEANASAALVQDENGYFVEAPASSDPIADQVMAEMRGEARSALEKEAMTAQPPEKMAKVLTQESDGQIKLVIPEGKHLEKQITGQLSIEDIRAEWERMKQESREKQDEEVRQQVLRHTGSMFTKFEEAMRDNILRQMEEKDNPSLYDGADSAFDQLGEKNQYDSQGLESGRADYEESGYEELGNVEEGAEELTGDAKSAGYEQTEDYSEEDGFESLGDVSDAEFSEESEDSASQSPEKISNDDFGQDAGAYEELGNWDEAGQWHESAKSSEEPVIEIGQELMIKAGFAAEEKAPEKEPDATEEDDWEFVIDESVQNFEGPVYDNIPANAASIGSSISYGDAGSYDTTAETAHEKVEEVPAEQESDEAEFEDSEAEEPVVEPNQEEAPAAEAEEKAEALAAEAEETETPAVEAEQEESSVVEEKIEAESEQAEESATETEQTEKSVAEAEEKAEAELEQSEEPAAEAEQEEAPVVEVETKVEAEPEQAEALAAEAEQEEAPAAEAEEKVEAEPEQAEELAAEAEQEEAPVVEEKVEAESEQAEALAAEAEQEEAPVVEEKAEAESGQPEEPAAEAEQEEAPVVEEKVEAESEQTEEPASESEKTEESVAEPKIEELAPEPPVAEETKAEEGTKTEEETKAEEGTQEVPVAEETKKEETATEVPAAEDKKSEESAKEEAAKEPVVEAEPAKTEESKPAVAENPQPAQDSEWESGDDIQWDEISPDAPAQTSEAQVEAESVSETEDIDWDNLAVEEENGNAAEGKQNAENEHAEASGDLEFEAVNFDEELPEEETGDADSNEKDQTGSGDAKEASATESAEATEANASDKEKDDSEGFEDPDSFVWGEDFHDGEENQADRTAEDQASEVNTEKDAVKEAGSQTAEGEKAEGSEKSEEQKSAESADQADKNAEAGEDKSKDAEAQDAESKDADSKDKDAKDKETSDEDSSDEEYDDLNDEEDEDEEDEEGSEDEKNSDSSVRQMTKEEKELYGSLIQTKSSREQLVKAIDSVSMAAYTGNIIITGEAGLNILELAKKMISEIRQSDSNFSGKVAKLAGKALNTRNVAETLESLKNGALIIDKVASISDGAAIDLYKSLQQESYGIIVVLLDTRKHIDRFLKDHEELKTIFNARVDMRPLSVKVLVAYAKEYAREHDYSIGDLGMLALHTKIDEMQTATHAVTKEDVKEIMDDAMFSASRKTIGHFFDILLAKRYDEEDMIIITEKDFE